ncbi:MAG: cysteine hydrolase [Dehalococcoidia bacterium]|nr:cysteine hydrolase [Dehalococcoidia bacterium]
MLIEAVPYPWPYDGFAAVENTALVLVAPQIAFTWMDPAGRVVSACETISEAAARAGMAQCIIRLGRTAVTPQRMPGLPAPGSYGWEYTSNFEISGRSLVIDAPALDGFYATGLDSALRVRRITHLVFAGFGTETMVHSTLRSANDRGFECLVLSDACADVSPDLHHAALSSIMMSGGIFGAYAESQAFLAGLNQRP